LAGEDDRAPVVQPVHDASCRGRELGEVGRLRPADRRRRLPGGADVQLFVGHSLLMLIRGARMMREGLVALAVAGLLAIRVMQPAAQAPPYDLLLKNGRIVDG